MEEKSFRIKRKQVVDVEVTEMVVSRTFNDGNYESTRIELRAIVDNKKDVNKVFQLTLDKIHELRQIQLLGGS